MIAGHVFRAACLARIAWIAAAATAIARPAVAAAQPPYAAIADARLAGLDGTRELGAPAYHTLGAAIASLAPNGAERQVVFVRAGRYHEKLTIEVPRLTLVGESRDSTVITYDAAAGLPTPTGGTWGTRGSGTLRIIAPDFRAEHLTIENAFDYIANMRKAKDDPTKVANAQGVALTLDSGSDRASFADVRVTGHQDTFFANAGRAYFYRSTITGSVDFIFGAGIAVFDSCDIVSRDRGSATNNGYITAASTARSQPYGLLFIHTRLSREVPTLARNSVALGRPWHPFADQAIQPSVVFVECWMDEHIGARGWDRMGMTDSTGQRVWAEPESARFFEYHSSGPGAVPGPNRRVLSDADAARYTVVAALGGWMPPVRPSFRTPPPSH